MMDCRHCGSPLSLPFLDLGCPPPSNAYLTEVPLNGQEQCYPLRVLVCTACWLAQTEDFAGREHLFTDEYAYFSSFSSSWLAHAKQYVDDMVDRFGLTGHSTVVEIAANDGYLLQYVKEKGIPCYGVEPTSSTAEAARAKGIEIHSDFFGAELGKKLAVQGGAADLVVANNVLAHVPDINDFLKGFRFLLKPEGVTTFEFPHLLQMVRHHQFDTVYHEHYSYLSLTAITKIFEKNGLSIFDVQQWPTHGGSLRIFAQRTDTGSQPVSGAVSELLATEAAEGMATERFYSGFQNQAEKIKADFLKFLRHAKRQGKKVGAYGAAAKGNTLLNFSGIRPDLLPWVVDRNPAKQGKYLPGSAIPIIEEHHLKTSRPDFVIILPWNLWEEVTSQLNYIRQWNAKFVRAVPELEIV